MAGCVCGVGILEASAAGPGTLILDARGGFDAYHNLATGAGFSGFRSLAGTEGFSLEAGAIFSDQTLLDAAALVLLQPYSPEAACSNDEIAAIQAFVNRGGRLLVLGDGGTGSDASYLNRLSSTFGVTYAATPSDALGATIDQFVTNGLTAGVTSASVDYQRRLTVSTPAIDLTVGSGAADFLAVSGRAVFLGDSSLFMEADDFSDASLTDRSNEQLARNILHFLATPPAQVVGRRVYYNRSVWDGNDDAANAADDAAIATDKSALRPGQKATFANYTSYSRGVNGVMIDVERLPGTPTASDFTFRTGNSPDPGTWSTAAAPASVVVRRGAGVGGSDRVVLTWGTDAVKKAWLQVTVWATAATGLVQPDVFYFGNAVGETGNSTTDARVTATDALRVLGHVSLSSTVADPYDLNRDGRVGAGDRLQVLANLSALSPLILLDLTAVGGDGASRRGPAGFELSGVSLRIESGAGGRVRVRSLGLGENAAAAELESSRDGVRWERADGWSRQSGEAGLEWVGPVSAEICRFFRVVVGPRS